MINPHDHCNLKKISMMHNSFPEVQHDHEERKLIESIINYKRYSRCMILFSEVHRDHE